MVRLAAVALVAAPLAATVPSVLGSTAAGADTGAVVVGGAPSGNGGVWTTNAAGVVHPYSGAPDLGSAPAHLRDAVVGMDATPAGDGYWLAARDGGVFSFGTARFYGSAAPIHLAAPIDGMAATPGGGGYWLLGTDGGVFSFGTARFYGSAAAYHPTTPVVGMAATPDGGGYWQVGADGGLFSFGDARFFGSAAPLHLSSPVVGMAPTTSGQGYWLATRDGRVFAFGDAPAAGVATPSGLAAIVSSKAGGFWAVPSAGAPVAVGPVAGAAGTHQRTKVPAPGPTPSPAPSPTATPTATTPTTAAPGPAPAPTPARFTFGVMEADPTWVTQDTAAGVRLATLNVDWSRWEPAAGVMDPAYAALVTANAAAFRAAGWQVAVDIGLQQAPGWVTQLANGQLVDQTGAGSGTPNFEFNQSVRDAAAGYIANIVAALGPVQSYRVGLSQTGEMTYPIATASQWFGFDAIAQGHAAGLPAGVGTDPMPGWVPGTPTWNGAAVTAAQTQAWYDWYLGALANAHAWQIAAYRAAGFGGLLQLVMPGDGAFPEVYSQRIAAGLAAAPYDAYGTMNSGAVWWKVLDLLPNLANTAVDISSVGDGSGAVGQTVCLATDDSVAMAAADPWSSSWSDSRWLTWIAHQHHLPVTGENPGNTAATNVANVVAIAKGCGLTALQWAWDFQLNQNSGYATLAQVSAAVAAA